MSVQTGPSKKCVALIPARAGSKRFPDKNIYPFFGHPLIAYSIASALESGVFSKVVVSTDSETYAKIARHYGAEAPFLRPTEIAGEHSLDIEWVEDALGRLKRQQEEFECFSLLRPTSPFRRAETIRRAAKQFFSESGIDSLRAVEKCRQHPGKMWIVNGRRMNPLLSQDPSRPPMHSTQVASLPEIYVQNASLEIAYTRVVFARHTISGNSIMPFFTEGFEGVDINEPRDLWYAEHLVAAGQAHLPEVHPAPYGPEVSLKGS